MALGELPQPLRPTAFSLMTARSVGVSRDRLRHRSIAHPGRALYVGPEAGRHWLTLASGWLQLLPDGTALCGSNGLAANCVPVRDVYPIHVLVPPEASRPRFRWSTRRGVGGSWPGRLRATISSSPAIPFCREGWRHGAIYVRCWRRFRGGVAQPSRERLYRSCAIVLTPRRSRWFGYGWSTVACPSPRSTPTCSTRPEGGSAGRTSPSRLTRSPSSTKATSIAPTRVAGVRTSDATRCCRTTDGRSSGSPPPT